MYQHIIDLIKKANLSRLDNGFFEGEPTLEKLEIFFSLPRFGLDLFSSTPLENLPREDVIEYNFGLNEIVSKLPKYSLDHWTFQRISMGGASVSSASYNPEIIVDLQAAINEKDFSKIDTALSVVSGSLLSASSYLFGDKNREVNFELIESDVRDNGLILNSFLRDDEVIIKSYFDLRNKKPVGLTSLLIN